MSKETQLKKLRDLRIELRNDLFKKFKRLFEEQPKLSSVLWTQIYHKGSSDGDWKFCMSSEDCLLNNLHVESLYDDKIEKVKENMEWMLEMFEAVTGILTDQSEWAMEFMFGVGSNVIVTIDGFKIEEIESHYAS